MLGWVKGHRKATATALVMLLLGAGAAVALGSRDRSPAPRSTPAPQSTRSTPSTVGTTSRAEAASRAVESPAATAAPPVGAPAGTADLTPVGPTVVKTGTLDLRVARRHLDDAMARVAAIAGRDGMEIQQSQSGAHLATYTLRVPVEGFDAALAELAKVGTVTGSSRSSQDATAQAVDLQARLRNQQAQEAVLLDLMRQAKTIQDTITVQQQLSQVQEQIEELRGQIRQLDDRATYATLTLTITERGAAVSPARTTHDSELVRAWHRAVDGTLAVLGGTLIVLGTLLPLALIATILAVTWTVVRRIRRDRARAAMS